jgi:antitoxin ParD1/3/4
MPAAPRTISFTERHLTLIDRMLQEGRHQSSSEVVREAMRRYEAQLEHEAAHLAYLKRLGDEGEADLAAGRYTDVPYDELESHLEALGRRAQGR